MFVSRHTIIYILLFSCEAFLSSANKESVTSIFSTEDAETASVSLLQVQEGLALHEGKSATQKYIKVHSQEDEAENTAPVTSAAVSPALLQRLQEVHWTLKFGAVVILATFLTVVFAAISKGSSSISSISNEKLAGSQQDSEDASATSMGPAMSAVVFFVLGQCLSASTLTVVNKWAMNSFHPPGAAANHHGYIWTLSFIQFLVSALVARLVGFSGLAKCDPLQWKKAVAYFPAAGMFMITIVAGNAVMNYSNVASFLVLRSLVPIPCALLEMFIYKDPLPPIYSWLGLGVVVAGAVIYGQSMGGFEFAAAAWAMIFLVCMPVDALLIKHAISASGLSAWGLVYYNNMLAALPLVFFVVVFEVPSGLAAGNMLHALISEEARLAVIVSCIVGISMSFFQMTTRYYISATAFMILGVVNKFLTVFWNEVFIDRSSMLALSGVLLTLGGAIAWQMCMGNSSVKVRQKSETSESTAILAFGATIAGLVAAGLVQHYCTAH